MDKVVTLVTECFGAQEVDIFFYENIFILKRNCVLRTLKNSFAIFSVTDIHTRLGPLKGAT